MEKQAYSLLESEESWWYRGRSLMIAAALMRSKVSQLHEALDYGAGYGGMYAELARIGRNVFAFEPDDAARAAAETRQYKSVYANEETAFSHKYDLVGLFDVVEHIEDDRAFLRRLWKVLEDRGFLIITVPAFQFLWSDHDVNLHHYRRYTKKSLRTLLDLAGYKISFISYWNMSLFLPMAAMRLLGRSGESGLSLPKSVDALFLGAIRLEAAIMRASPLPFGTGLVAVAQKNAEIR